MLKLSTKSWLTTPNVSWYSRNAPIVELDNVIFINGAGYDKVTLSPLFDVQLHIPAYFENFGIYTKKSINVTRQIGFSNGRHINTDILFANASTTQNCYYFYDDIEPNKVWINASFSYRAAGVITCIDTETFEPDKQKTYLYDTNGGTMFKPIIFSNESLFITATHLSSSLASRIGATYDYRSKRVIRAQTFSGNYSRVCLLFRDENNNVFYFWVNDSYNKRYLVYKYRVGSAPVLLRNQSLGLRHMCVPTVTKDTNNNLLHIFLPDANNTNSPMKIKYMTLDLNTENLGTAVDIIHNSGDIIPVISNDRFGYTLYHLEGTKFLLFPISDSNQINSQIYPVALINIDLSSNTYDVLTTYNTSYGNVISALRYNDNIFVRLNEQGFELIRVNTVNNTIEQIFADSFNNVAAGLGIDELNRIWVVTKDGNILMYSPDTHIKLDIEITQENYIWTGSPIQTQVSVRAYDLLDNQVSVPVRLEIMSNNAKFTTNDLKVIDITTSDSQTTTVNITITGPGSLIVKGRVL